MSNGVWIRNGPNSYGPNYSKSGPWSGFRLVGTIIDIYDSSQPFKIRPPKCPDFEGFRILIGLISYNHYTLFSQETILSMLDQMHSEWIILLMDSDLLNIKWQSRSSGRGDRSKLEFEKGAKFEVATFSRDQHLLFFVKFSFSLIKILCPNIFWYSDEGWGQILAVSC